MNEFKQVLQTIAKIIIYLVLVTTALYFLQKPGFKEALLGYVATTIEFIDHVLKFREGV